MDYSLGHRSHCEAIILFQSEDPQMAPRVPDSKKWRLNLSLQQLQKIILWENTCCEYIQNKITMSKTHTSCQIRKIWGCLLWTIFFILMSHSRCQCLTSRRHRETQLRNTAWTESSNFSDCTRTLARREFARPIRQLSKMRRIVRLRDENRCVDKHDARRVLDFPRDILMQEEKPTPASQNKLGPELLFCIWLCRLLQRLGMSPRGIELSAWHAPLFTAACGANGFGPWTLWNFTATRAWELAAYITPKDKLSYLTAATLEPSQVLGERWGHDRKAKPSNVFSPPHSYLFAHLHHNWSGNLRVVNMLPAVSLWQGSAQVSLLKVNTHGGTRERDYWYDHRFIVACCTNRTYNTDACNKTYITDSSR